MLCAISGEAPQIPVASRKSGNIFEKRLIETHISQHHTDPVTGEDLEVEDLIELKTARVVRPRPPTLTSIPALLSIFQNEWDAIALETFTLKQHLAQVRQELSTALYQNDAATRVIARMMKERDEAREALSKVTVSGSGAANGDAMQVDSQELPDELAAKVDQTQQSLSTTRRRRPIPDNWATSDVIEAYDTTEATDALYPGGNGLAVDETGDLVLLGGSDGVAGVYSLSQKAVVHALKPGSGAVTAAVWSGSRAIVGTSTGTIKSFENGTEVAESSSHAGAVTSLALHPSSEILASTGADKSYKLYDLASLNVVAQVYTESQLLCGEFHPDGHLFAAGSKDGQIKVYGTKNGTNEANFTTGGPVQAISFSENGTWLAEVVQGQTGVSIWDLRKNAIIETLNIGSPVQSIKWDYTGQYLATAGSGSVSVQHYTKSSKSWSEPFKKAIAAKSVQWGKDARQLIALTPDGGLNILG